jgi:hypothetical protein
MSNKGLVATAVRATFAATGDITTASAVTVLATANLGALPEGEKQKGRHKQPAADSDDPLVKVHRRDRKGQSLIKYCRRS